jgi:phosphatidylglycerophosphatase A
LTDYFVLLKIVKKKHLDFKIFSRFVRHINSGCNFAVQLRFTGTKLFKQIIITFASHFRTMNQKYLFHKIISTGFGSGYFPKAPGTAGAVLAGIVWWILSVFFPQSLILLTAVLIVVFTVLGVWSSGVVEAFWGKDPSRVVVDEMVGVWIPLLAVGDGNICYALFALAAFRFFDILKPLGIRRMEMFKGGWGIMLDDVVAGIYSLLVLIGLRWLIG